MRWWHLLASFLLGFAVASGIFLRRNERPQSNPMHADAESSKPAVRTTSGSATGNPGMESGLPRGARSPMQHGSRQPTAVPTDTLTFVIPDLTSMFYVQKMLADSPPEASASFSKGWSLIQGGRFLQARDALQAVCKSYPEHEIKYLADWAIGFTYYGGEPTISNLAYAGDHFQNASEFLANADGMGELAEVTLVNRAVIDFQMLKQREGDSVWKITRAGLISKELQQFLNRAPDDPQAPAARTLVKEMQDLLARVP